MQHRMRGIGAGILAAILTMALAFGNGTVPAIADENAPAPSTHNAIVLVLDNSGSMSGEPIERLKTATKQFVDKVLAKDPEGKIALVAFSDDTNVQDFTSDKNALDSFADNNLWGDSGTDVTAGLKKADELYSGLKDTDTVRYKRSIVTMSDGWPNDADSATAQAKSMFPKYSMYSVGFYPYQDNSAAEFMKSIQNAGYYEADNLDALIDVFTKIVDIILNPLDISLLTTATYLPAEDNISYSVTATIANTNNATVTGVKAALTPNDNINFTGTSERNVGDIKPQERKTLTWEGLTQKNHNDTSGTYSVIVSGTNVATISKTARITFNDSTTQDNKIVFGKDNWSFKNFGDWKLSRTDREALLDNASLFTNRNANRAELEDFIVNWINGMPLGALATAMALPQPPFLQKWE